MTEETRDQDGGMLSPSNPVKQLDDEGNPILYGAFGWFSGTDAITPDRAGLKLAAPR